jgi:hypothetical protein
MPLKLEHSDIFGRVLRFDEPIEELTTSTLTRLKEAARRENKDEVLQLIDYLLWEAKGLHDLFCDWSYAFLTWIADNYGEEELPKVYRWCKKKVELAFYSKITEKNKLKVTQKELMCWFTEQVRNHRTGTVELGTFELVEEEDRYVWILDPCPSGGRMRLYNDLDGTPARTGPPFDFGRTKKAYSWSWSKKGVPYYCLHCCIWHEQMAIEAQGFPTKITDYCDDPEVPCKNYFYKSPELIPEEYYTRIGMKKPDRFKKK